ncbi:uncharacterized protein LOC122808427 [Protopterus annectens]|uniref:uncharacterized protein LOC122808427 n=1 Tax=Protopterus annectens TaxID=7888 RepID=UPI001CFBB82B|nr:uncharacterized protein LOC122808427 [Protopterus annectens]
MAVSCSNGIKRTSQEFLFKNGCVFFSAFLLCFPLSLAATITVINDPVTAALGDNVTLGISIDESVVLCTWYRGAVDVTNFILRVANGVQAEGSQYTRRESVLQPSHSLRIANATLADSGTYWVRIVFTSGNEVLSNLTLKVLGILSAQHEMHLVWKQLSLQSTLQSFYPAKCVVSQVQNIQQLTHFENQQRDYALEVIPLSL